MSQDLERRRSPGVAAGADDANAGARAELLDAVARASFEAPREEYTAEGAAYGVARLRRATTGTGSWTELVVELGPAVVAAVYSKGGSPTPTASFNASMVAERGGPLANEVLAGLRSLLVEHRLLENPKLLWSETSAGIPTESPAEKSLAALREVLLAKVRTGRDFLARMECAPCRGVREAREKAAGEAEIARLESVIAETRAPNEAARLKRELLERRDALMYGRAAGAKGASQSEECPHARLRLVALEALCTKHPALAFEAAGLLRPAFSPRPSRFALRPDVIDGAVEQWQASKARDRYSAWLDWYGNPNGQPQPRAAAVARPKEPAVVATPAAPEPEPKKLVAVERKRKSIAPAPAPRVRAKAKPKPEPEQASTAMRVGEELMTSDLRDRGYSAPDIKRMLKEGAIERASYGWFRVVRAT